MWKMALNIILSSINKRKNVLFCLFELEEAWTRDGSITVGNEKPQGTRITT